MRPTPVLAVLAVLYVLPPCSAAAVEPVAAATYVGSARCGGCHADQLAQWRGSHHDRAMETVGDDTVLGDFADSQFTHDGVTTRFFRKQDKYFVNTVGADGKARDFEVAYTFGFDPLQQYLLDVGGGRLQALSIAWDSRPRQAGGQRWFHLQPDDPVDSDDPLHWSGPLYNWNARCAYCHSTNLRKNFDLATRTYKTTWSEIDVACEACHGPGSAHLEWAAKKTAGDEGAAAPRYTVDLSTARREIETCAPCHSRRHALVDPAPPGGSYLDAFVPELLREGLYFADGEIEDEVYVYGSFAQSKMHAAGVRCSDCHDPHSLRLRAAGDAVCTQCHNPGGNTRFPTLRPHTYDDAAHHHHAAGSPAARCVACHMPARNYMVLDDRRDHSMRIPRPDLSVTEGVPNACNGCHADKPPQWAATAVEEWFGTTRNPHWTTAISAGRAGRLGAGTLLTAIATDAAQPAIVRATAVELLERSGPSGATATLRLLGDAEPLVRAAAARSLDGVPANARAAALPLLSDPVRAVRVDAARPLAAVPRDQLSAAQRAALDTALDEYRAAQQVNLDTPEAHLNLGLLHAALGETAEAQRSYQTAIDIGPYFIPAYVNLADLHRASGRETDADRVLRSALAADADNADVLHSLGLSLVRQRKTDEAVAALGRAAELAPAMPRYAYTYGVALHSTGKPSQAIDVLYRAHQLHPTDVDIVAALLNMHRERGELDESLLYARKLAALVPGDPNVAGLVASIERESALQRRGAGAGQ